MSGILSKGQIEDLIEYCGSEATRWKNDDMLICCPVHGESNPSMGISADLQVCHCFSCGFAGDFAWLLYKSRPDDFKSVLSAREFLKDRYELEYRIIGRKLKSVKRYEQTFKKYFAEERKELPRYKIAPFMSGKETYKYFYDRGFNSADMKKFCIGRDLVNQTVTLPVFYEDNVLAGVIGRYISAKRKKNERYKIYDSFQRGEILYPLNLYAPINGTAILVEGQFDVIMLHKYGYTNALAKMGVELTSKQADLLCKLCSSVIWICDNDERSRQAFERDKKLLKDRVRILTVDYPDYGKDVCDWSKNDIDLMIGNSHSTFTRKIRRL